MKINTECEICNLKIKNAVRCTQCNNFFCKSCIEKWINTNEDKNSQKSCPHCRVNNFNYKPYPELDRLINSSPTLKCEKCNRIFFNKQEFKEHQLLCLQVKCIICHEIFQDNASFINHFEKEGKYYEKVLICNYLNANIYDHIANNNNTNKEKNDNETSPDILDCLNITKNKELNNDIIKDEKEIKSFQNNFKNNKVSVNINKNYIPDNYKGRLFRQYDIYYCLNDNRVNNKRCFPGNELCPTCMKINQEYHKLKKHYLINAAGRVCTYSRNKVHCLCHFERLIKKEDKYFCPNLTCYNNNICRSCSDMSSLLRFYFDEKLINKLIKRDQNNGY
jgi:hypothetical protein